jgi:hypothetical protein
MHNEAFRIYFKLGNSKLIGKYLENIFPSLSKIISSFGLSGINEIHEFNFEDKTFELCIKPLQKRIRI